MVCRVRTGSSESCAYSLSELGLGLFPTLCNKDSHSSHLAGDRAQCPVLSQCPVLADGPSSVKPTLTPPFPDLSLL